MSNRTGEHSTRQERAIMDTVFGLGNRATAEDIRAADSPPSDSSVRVMLGRLETKGCLKQHEKRGRYMYSSTVPPMVAQRTALRQHLKAFLTDQPGRW